MAPPDDNPPSSLDRYTIERLLGSGAMGSVYLAHDTRLRRRVALKILGAGVQALGVDTIAAAMREARAAGAIAHPNAAAVFDASELNGAAYIVMEYVPGTPLRRFIGDASVPMALRVRWLCDIASALTAAHAVGVVHRDVKPENVMIRDDGIVKVLDFGVARIVESDEGRAAPHITWTQDGAFVGTPGYMAPEIIRGQAADSRADQFGWGVLAYELLTGRSPWKRDDNPLSVIPAVLTQTPEPLGPEVPKAVAAVVLRAMSKTPDERFPSLGHAAYLITEFADAAPFRMALDPVAMGGAPAYPPAQPAPRPTPPLPSREPLPNAADLSSVPRVPWGTLSSAGVAPSGTQVSQGRTTGPRSDEPSSRRSGQKPSDESPPTPASFGARRQGQRSTDPRREEPASSPSATRGTRATPVFPTRTVDPRSEDRAPAIPPRRAFESIHEEPLSPGRRPLVSAFDSRADDPTPAPRTAPRRPFDSRVDDPTPAPRMAPIPQRRPIDAIADDPTPAPRAIGFPPRRPLDSRPDDPTPAPRAVGFPPRRPFDSRPDDPTPKPRSAPPRRAFDSRPDDPTPKPRSAPIPGRRPFDPPGPPRAALPGFHQPDFSAPIDVQAHITMLPPGATCKGMFFGDLFLLAGKLHNPVDLALLAGIPDRRYVGFRDYPMRDAMRLAVAVAAVVHPRLSLGEALRRLGKRSLELVLDSHAGRTLFGVLPRDVDAYLTNAPRAFQMLLGFGEVTAARTSSDTYRLEARDMPLFLETYQVGVLESVLAHCGVFGEIEICMAGLASATVSVRLRRL